MTHSQLITSTRALGAMQRGVDKLAGLLAATLGPTRGLVLHDRGNRAPELLTDSGTIARRMIELPARGDDVGAMTLRNAVWAARERYGDGAATTAVLVRAMVHEAARRVAAGYDPMLMRRGMERATAAAAAALVAQAQPARGTPLLTRLATGISGDAELGALIGEMFDVLGPNAALTIEPYAAPYLEREYLDGGRWEARIASHQLLPAGGGELALANPRVAVVDQELTSLAQVRPLLELVAGEGREPLLLVARKVAGEALGALVLNHTKGALTVAAVELTNLGFVTEELADLALLAGAGLLADAADRPLARVGAADLGRARGATLGRGRLTIVGGSGSPEAIRARIAQVRHQLSKVGRSDAEWERLRMRAACLAGGVGVLKVGAYTQAERELRYERARKAVRGLELALAEGVVPGGGVAYLGLAEAALGAREACASDDEAEGVAVVAAALAAPFRQIVHNYGELSPAVALDQVRRLGPGYGFDAQRGEYVCMAEAGVLDSLAVTRGALEVAASAAAMIITTEVLVLASSRRRQRAVEP
jgi:chaperonin GroEL